MTPREAIISQIEHRETAPVPFTLGMDGEFGEEMSRRTGSDSWREKLTPYIKSGGGIPTMAKEPIDDVLERDLFGSTWRMDKRPFHLETPGLKKPSFDGYTFPSADMFAVPDLKEKVEKAKSEYPDSFITIGMGWGLWESSWGIRGFENAMMDCIAEPDFYGELLDRLTDLFLSHVAQCENVDADAVMFGDDWGDQRGVLMGPERWRQFFKPRYAKIYDAVHKQGKTAISHCCGSVVDIMPDIIEIGLDVLESVQPEARGMNPYELKRNFGNNITFWGCLGSQSTIQFGTPDQIRAEIKKLCAEMGRGGGFIIAPAKGFQPGTPLENAVAVFESFTNQE
jgi:uroporphyrinogen decarboxylase